MSKIVFILTPIEKDITDIIDKHLMKPFNFKWKQEYYIRNFYNDGGI